MCGILGQAAPAVDRAAFGRALDLMAHRGPDGEGVYTAAHGDEQVVLGHRRLAIIDLSPGGAQPMTSADGRYTIVFNGEIYNYRELRRELEAEGASFRSSSDTEVLLELFARRGPAMLADLNGIFAFAVYDRDGGELTFARDHLGVKPFYYHLGGRAFTFGSEIKALLALGVPARLNHACLGEYLAQMWVQEPDTLFAGIMKLPAGHWGRYRAGRLHTEPFWDVSPALLDHPPADPAARLAELLSDAVHRQLIADRPVGTYVSGGVDSSLITHLAAEEAPGLIAVSARFAAADQRYEGVADDGAWIDRFAAAHPGLRYHDLLLQPELFDEYRELIWHLDEPIADPAIVPACLLARQARAAGAVVMLNGMGGDELFAGYGRYAGVRALAVTDALPGSARQALRAVAAGVQRLAAGPAARAVGNAQRFLGASVERWPLAYAGMLGHFPLADVDALAGGAWREPYESKLRAVLAGFEDASRLTQAQRLDLKGFLASHNLIYTDKASMAASVEVRVPLLDYRLAELAFSLPDALRAGGRQQKILLKRYCAQLVDPEIAYRRKAGFAMPIRAWLRQRLRSQVERALTGGPVAGLLDRAHLATLLDEHYAGKLDHTWRLWTLLTLDLWLERFAVAA